MFGIAYCRDPESVITYMLIALLCVVTSILCCKNLECIDFCII